MRLTLLVLLAAVTMGNGCPQNKTTHVYCQGFDYPHCSDVDYDYPCLCLSSPEGVTSIEAEGMRYATGNG